MKTSDSLPNTGNRRLRLWLAISGAAAIVVLAVVLIISTTADQPSSSKSPVIITSGGETITPYLWIKWSRTWTGHGWVAADSLQLNYNLPEIAEDTPVVRYHDDLKIKSSGSIYPMTIYNEKYQFLDHIDTYDKVNYQTVLSKLPEGTYYVAVTTEKRGRFIWSQMEHESASYDCIFKLVVTEQNP